MDQSFRMECMLLSTLKGNLLPIALELCKVQLLSIGSLYQVSGIDG